MINSRKGFSRKSNASIEVIAAKTIPCFSSIGFYITFQLNNEYKQTLGRINDTNGRDITLKAT